MYTPQEVRESSASFDRAVFGGYNMKSVDDFLTPLVEDYSALYKENAVLKSKLKVLVEKLEEFHAREESMNKAIMAAQKAADEMVLDTERKCARMLSDTEETMRVRREQLQQELDMETERVNRAKKTAAAFILHVEEQMHKAVEQLEDVREMALVPRKKQPAVQPELSFIPREETPVPQRETPDQVSRQIEMNISRIINGQEEEPLPQSEETVYSQDFDEPVEYTGEYTGEYTEAVDCAGECPEDFEASDEPEDSDVQEYTPVERQRTPEEILGDTMVIHPIRE